MMEREASLRCSFGHSEEMKKKRNMRVPTIEASSTLGLSSQSSMLTTSTARRVLQRAVESHHFEAATILLVLSNVAFFGVEVQALMGTTEEDTPAGFKAVGYTYTGLFSAELLLRGLAHGPTMFFAGENRAWNVMDMVLVFLSWTELIVGIITGGGEEYQLEYVRVIRVARTVRIFRILRIVKFFRALRILVYSVMSTLRSLAWTMVLLAIIIYSFGVVFAMAASQAFAGNAASDERQLRKYFGSLWISIATLFKSISGGMDWQHGADALGSVHEAWAMLFVAYIAFSQLGVLNVVTGVVCQTAMESAQQDQDVVMQSQLASKQKYIRQFHDLFMCLDTNGSGHISLEEFEDRLQDPSVQAYFAAMDLTTDEAWSLFKLLDEQETALIDVEEFVSGCLKLRGTARSIDVHMLKYESKWTMKRISAIARSISDLSVGGRHLSPGSARRGSTATLAPGSLRETRGKAVPGSPRPMQQQGKAGVRVMVL